MYFAASCRSRLSWEVDETMPKLLEPKVAPVLLKFAFSGDEAQWIRKLKTVKAYKSHVPMNGCHLRCSFHWLSFLFS